jgi:chromosome segregation ATPase
LDGIRRELLTADLAYGPLISEARFELKAREGAFAEKEKEVVRLAGELAARERKLTKKDKHIVELSNELKKRDREIAEEENRIYALSGVLRERDGELAEKLEDLVSLSVSLSERNHELGQKNEEFLRLSSQLQVTAHQLKRMERVLQGVLSSKSWRVTKPLRDWAATWRSLRKKLAFERTRSAWAAGGRRFGG